MYKTITKPLKNNKIKLIIFQKGKKWYGVVLEFNIIEIYKDLNTTLYNLIEATTGYIETVIKNNIQLSSLTQTPDKIIYKINSIKPHKNTNFKGRLY